MENTMLHYSQVGSDVVGDVKISLSFDPENEVYFIQGGCCDEYEFSTFYEAYVVYAGSVAKRANDTFHAIDGSHLQS